MSARSARETLRCLIAEILSKISSKNHNVTHTLLCMAGSPEFWRETSSTLTGLGLVETTTDAAPVLELATSGQPGLVLHAGTGSFVALNDSKGAFHYAGGLGWRLGDPGSALDIGRRAIAHGIAELQGWAEKSHISDALAELFNTATPSAITAALHRSSEPNQLIGSFATCVSQLAAGGDEKALAIIIESARQLLECAESSARALIGMQYLDTIPAGMSGPILTQPFIAEALRQRTRLPLKPLAEPPIEGVRRLLLRKS